MPNFVHRLFPTWTREINPVTIRDISSGVSGQHRGVKKQQNYTRHFQIPAGFGDWDTVSGPNDIMRLWNTFVQNPVGDTSPSKRSGHIHVTLELLSAVQPGNERWNMGEGPLLPLFLSFRARQGSSQYTRPNATPPFSPLILT